MSSARLWRGYFHCIGQVDVHRSYLLGSVFFKFCIAHNTVFPDTSVLPGKGFFPTQCRIPQARIGLTSDMARETLFHRLPGGFHRAACYTPKFCPWALMAALWRARFASIVKSYGKGLRSLPGPSTGLVRVPGPPALLPIVRRRCGGGAVSLRYCLVAHGRWFGSSARLALCCGRSSRSPPRHRRGGDGSASGTQERTGFQGLHGPARLRVTARACAVPEAVRLIGSTAPVGIGGASGPLVSTARLHRSACTARPDCT